MDHLPQPFLKVRTSIASEGMPVYTNGALSCLLILGDLVCLGIAVPPAEDEIAKIIVKANSGAVRGLEVLRYECNVDHVSAALVGIRHALNVELLPSVKILFNGGEVELFDEHIICRVASKQIRPAMRSTIWLPKPDKRVSKWRIERQQIDDSRRPHKRPKVAS